MFAECPRSERKLFSKACSSKKCPDVDSVKLMPFLLMPHFEKTFRIMSLLVFYSSCRTRYQSTRTTPSLRVSSSSHCSHRIVHDCQLAKHFIFRVKFFTHVVTHRPLSSFPLSFSQMAAYCLSSMRMERPQWPLSVFDLYLLCVDRCMR